MKKKILSVFVCIALCICTVLFISGCKKKNTISVSFYVDETLYSKVKVRDEKIKEMPLDPEKQDMNLKDGFMTRILLKMNF